MPESNEAYLGLANLRPPTGEPLQSRAVCSVITLTNEGENFMAAPLTLKDYRAQQEALDRDELGAHARLVELHPELRWWLVARLEVGPSDPALWGAAPNHPELSRRQLRAAYDAARLRQARLRYDKVQMLRRWAWECDGGVGQACVDVLSPPSDDTSDHVARHKHAIEVVAHALRDARWPVHHWGGHLNQHRCVLLRATA